MAKRHMKPTALGYYLITLPDYFGHRQGTWILFVSQSGKVMGATSCGDEHPSKRKATLRRLHAKLAKERESRKAAREAVQQ